jgi:hypothetical protein
MVSQWLVNPQGPLPFRKHLLKSGAENKACLFRETAKCMPHGSAQGQRPFGFGGIQGIGASGESPNAAGPGGRGEVCVRSGGSGAIYQS